jgi:hypothetical protein
MSQADGLGQPGTKLLFEDEHTRVWLLELEAGEFSEWHSHKSDYMFVVTRPGQVHTEYKDGSCEFQSDSVGHAEYRCKDRSHRLVNDSTSTYQNIVIEFLRR